MGHLNRLTVSASSTMQAAVRTQELIRECRIDLRQAVEGIMERRMDGSDDCPLCHLSLLEIAENGHWHTCPVVMIKAAQTRLASLSDM